MLLRINKETGRLSFAGQYKPVGTPAIILFLAPGKVRELPGQHPQSPRGDRVHALLRPRSRLCRLSVPACLWI
jgi:hypothetical protein